MRKTPSNPDIDYSKYIELIKRQKIHYLEAILMYDIKKFDSIYPLEAIYFYLIKKNDFEQTLYFFNILSNATKNYDEEKSLNIIKFKAHMLGQNFAFLKYSFKHLNQKEIEETIKYHFLGGAVLNSNSHTIELLYDLIKQNNALFLDYFFTHIICFFIRYECSLNVNIDINRLDLFFNFLDKFNFKLSDYKKIHSVILKNICNSYFIDNNTRAIESTLSLINYFINKGLSVNSHNYEFDKRPTIHLFLDYMFSLQISPFILLAFQNLGFRMDIQDQEGFSVYDILEKRNAHLISDMLRKQEVNHEKVIILSQLNHVEKSKRRL